MPSSKKKSILAAPDTNYRDDAAEPLHRKDNAIWAPLVRKWLEETPEEIVRQGFIYVLHTKYGFALSQMAQEVRTFSGRRSVRVDILVCRDAASLQANRNYVLAVEVKAETVPLLYNDYWQGESYARATGCEFLVLHNLRETRCVRLTKGAPGDRIEVEKIPGREDFESPERLAGIRQATNVFTRDQFRRLLYECHCILRDNHKMEPGAAFDEISKILFIKMAFERTGDRSRFTRAYIDRYVEVRRSNAADVMDDLFADTKKIYDTDKLFGAEDRLKISLATFKRIVGELESFDLSATSDDVKGIAFERFLGETFRGELGQFFTPRPIVDFMVGMLDPQEGDLVCDPASGTGGFLIKVFEYIRDQILRDIEQHKERARADIEGTGAVSGWDDEKIAAEIDSAFREINKELDPQRSGSRMELLASKQIYGVDAESRAARTSKMNMIMHGDGHGGMYYHDGLLDYGGVYPERFSIVITNPPFGSSVGSDQIVGATEQTSVALSSAEQDRFYRKYGDAWKRSFEELRSAARQNRPILGLFDIGRDPVGGHLETSSVRRNRTTEALFVERCIDLLHPGGKLGIVLPEGILNNSSNQWLRDYVETRAKILAVVSLPHEVFASAKATVKTSLVFMRRFTDQEVEDWAAARQRGEERASEELRSLIESTSAELDARAAEYGDVGIKCLGLSRKIEEMRSAFSVAERSKAQLARQLATADRTRYSRISQEMYRAMTQGPISEAATLRFRAKAAAISDAARAAFDANLEAEALRVGIARLHSEQVSVDPDGNTLNDVTTLLLNANSKIARFSAGLSSLALQRAREEFDYPVFMAEVEAAGITATGETGDAVPSELPAVMDAYRRFVNDLAGSGGVS